MDGYLPRQGKLNHVTVGCIGVTRQSIQVSKRQLPKHEEAYISEMEHAVTLPAPT